MLAMPALVNAHDHARPLSPTSFGAAGKPPETWLLRLATMPPIDPNPEAEVAVIASCVAHGEAPRYPPILAADYLKLRLDASKPAGP